MQDELAAIQLTWLKVFQNLSDFQSHVKSGYSWYRERKMKGRKGGADEGEIPHSF